MSLLQAWLSRWLMRAGVATGVLLLGLHLLLNKALLPLANRTLLPGLLADASRLSMREVRCAGEDALGKLLLCPVSAFGILQAVLCWVLSTTSGRIKVWWRVAESRCRLPFVLIGAHQVSSNIPDSNGVLLAAGAVVCLQVSVGGVSSVFLPGLLGIGPLVTLQQVEVGPGPYERSFLKVRLPSRGQAHRLCHQALTSCLCTCAAVLFQLVGETLHSPCA